jgi:hypothetical protein
MSAPDDARASGFAVPDVAIDIALVSAVLIKIADTIRGLLRAPISGIRECAILARCWKRRPAATSSRQGFSRNHPDRYTRTARLYHPASDLWIVSVEGRPLAAERPSPFPAGVPRGNRLRPSGGPHFGLSVDVAAQRYSRHMDALVALMVGLRQPYPRSEALFGDVE